MPLELVTLVFILFGVASFFLVFLNCDYSIRNTFTKVMLGVCLPVFIGTGVWLWVAENQKAIIISQLKVPVVRTDTTSYIEYTNYNNQLVQHRVGGTINNYRVTIYECWYAGIKFSESVDIEPVIEPRLIIDLAKPPPPGVWLPPSKLQDDLDKQASCGKCHDGKIQPKLDSYDPDKVNEAKLDYLIREIK